MLEDRFVSGWIQDPVEVQATIARRVAAGQPVMGDVFASTQRLDLRGTWARKKAAGSRGIFLRDCEPALLKGKYRRAYLQKFGTCVSRGMAHGLQLALDYAIANEYALLDPVEIAFAPIYSFARHEIGHDCCGSGDGAILAHAAQAVHDLGVATVDLFHGISEDEQERQAVKYGAPRVGSPDAWKQAAKGHTAVTFWPETLELLFDCLAAGFPVPYAHGRITGNPDRSGISKPGGSGAHCRYFSGVFVDENGHDQLLSSESWGRFPAGSPTDQDQTMDTSQIPRIQLRYAGGVKELAPGEVGAEARSFWAEIQSGGEAWAVGAPKFEPKKMTDLTDVGKAA